MSILSKIKTNQLAARKEKSTQTVALLTTLIGEAEMVGKNAGREVADSEVIAVVKKFIKNIDETIKALGNADPRTEVAMAERATLEAYLPKQLDEAQLQCVVTEIINDLCSRSGSPVQMGMVMGALKLGFEGQYDGKKASEIIKAALK